MRLRLTPLLAIRPEGTCAQPLQEQRCRPFLPLTMWDETRIALGSYASRVQAQSIDLLLSSLGFSPGKNRRRGKVHLLRRFLGPQNFHICYHGRTCCAISWETAVIHTVQVRMRPGLLKCNCRGQVPALQLREGEGVQFL